MLDLLVAKCIIKAQMCSDSGKGVNRTYSHSGWKNRSKAVRYVGKDEFIVKAINRILSLKGRSGFYFHSVLDYESCFWYPTIIYFNFKIEGKRYQISFHSHEYLHLKYAKICDSKNFQTHWDQKSSREACEILGEYILKNSEA